jgi:DnaJ-class molecular chaperone
MGFDVHGKKPTKSNGDYFRNNSWWWRPLAAYVLCYAGDQLEEKEKQYWSTNDGQEVSPESAENLGKKLLELVETGHTKEYAEQYSRTLQNIPDEKCWLCDGTGKRNDMIVQGTCNGCGGKGVRRPMATCYPFSVENVKEFAEFCIASGGFEIY